jgi:hypothetical protein
VVCTFQVGEREQQGILAIKRSLDLGQEPLTFISRARLDWKVRFDPSLPFGSCGVARKIHCAPLPAQCHRYNVVFLGSRN